MLDVRSKRKSVKDKFSGQKGRGQKLSLAQTAYQIDS